jgi:hypothetical protein
MYMYVVPLQSVYYIIFVYACFTYQSQYMYCNIVVKLSLQQCKYFFSKKSNSKVTHHKHVPVYHVI